MVWSVSLSLYLSSSPFEALVHGPVVFVCVCVRAHLCKHFSELLTCFERLPAKDRLSRNISEPSLADAKRQEKRPIACKQNKFRLSRVAIRRFWERSLKMANSQKCLEDGRKKGKMQRI